MKDSSWFPVNHGQYGDLTVKDNIQSKLSEMLDYMTEKHSKVLPLRFDLKYPAEMIAPHSNRHISRCMTKIRQKYHRQGLDPHFFWVREQDASHNPHYHCVLLLNGNKVRAFNHVFVTAAQLWGNTIGSDQKGLVYHCTDREKGIPRDNGTLLSRTDPEYKEKFQRVHWHQSYLSKTEDKAAPKDNLRDYGYSRMPKHKGDKI